MSRVIFNVGGKRFETHASTITTNRREPLDLLNMLLDHRKEGEEIFIDRDPKRFQHILNIYRGAGQVETDPEELDFYGLAPPPPPPMSENQKKRKKIEDDLIEHHEAYLKRVAIRREEEKDMCADLLFLCWHGPLTFVYATNDTKGDFSKASSTWRGRHYPEDFFRIQNFEQFRTYAASLGYRAEILESITKHTKFEHEPAKSCSFTAREKRAITVRLYFI